MLTTLQFTGYCVVDILVHYTKTKYASVVDIMLKYFPDEGATVYNHSSVIPCIQPHSLAPVMTCNVYSSCSMAGSTFMNLLYLTYMCVCV